SFGDSMMPSLLLLGLCGGRRDPVVVALNSAGWPRAHGIWGNGCVRGAAALPDACPGFQTAARPGSGVGSIIARPGPGRDLREDPGSRRRYLEVDGVPLIEQAMERHQLAALAGTGGLERQRSGGGGAHPGSRTGQRRDRQAVALVLGDGPRP